MDKKFEEQVKNQVQYPIYIFENIRKKKEALIALENKKKEIDNVLKKMAELKLKKQIFSYKKNFGSNIMVNKLKNCKNVTRETKMVEENSREKKALLLNILELQNDRLYILKNQINANTKN